MLASWNQNYTCMKSQENLNNMNFTHRFYIKAIYSFGKWVTMSVLKWTRISALTKMAFERHPIAFYSVRVDFPLIADHTTTSMTCERLNSKPRISSSKHSRTSSDLREHINVSCLPKRRVNSGYIPTTSKRHATWANAKNNLVNN